MGAERVSRGFPVDRRAPDPGLRGTRGVTRLAFAAHLDSPPVSAESKGGTGDYLQRRATDRGLNYRAPSRSVAGSVELST